MKGFLKDSKPKFNFFEVNATIISPAIVTIGP